MAPDDDIDISHFFGSPVTAKYLAVIGAVGLGLLLTKNILVENYVVAASISLLMLMICVDLWHGGKAADLPVPVPVVLTTLAATIVLTTVHIGTQAILWTFPAIIASFFLVSPFASALFSTALVSANCLYCWHVGDTPMLLRTGLAGAMTTLMMFFSMRHMRSLLARLHSSSLLDPLTGAYNRRHLRQTVDVFKASPEGAALLSLDIDNFKSINDRFGHETGDRVLRLVARIIDRNVRLSDTVFRFGGEEFLVLADGLSAVQAGQQAERIRRRVEELTGAGTCPVTVSIGVAPIAGGQPVDRAFQVADAQLYAAKRAGRNQVSIAPGAQTPPTPPAL